MTLQEAILFKDKHANIIGKTIDSQEVSDIVICPKPDGSVGAIAMEVLTYGNYEHLWVGSTDFDVLVLFDLQDFPTTGNLIFEFLENILQKRKS